MPDLPSFHEMKSIEITTAFTLKVCDWSPRPLDVGSRKALCACIFLFCGFVGYEPNEPLTAMASNPALTRPAAEPLEVGVADKRLDALIEEEQRSRASTSGPRRSMSTPPFEGPRGQPIALSPGLPGRQVRGEVDAADDPRGALRSVRPAAALRYENTLFLRKYILPSQGCIVPVCWALLSYHMSYVVLQCIFAGAMNSLNSKAQEDTHTLGVNKAF